MASCPTLYVKWLYHSFAEDNSIDGEESEEEETDSEGSDEDEEDNPDGEEDEDDEDDSDGMLPAAEIIFYCYIIPINRNY